MSHSRQIVGAILKRSVHHSTLRHHTHLIPSTQRNRSVKLRIDSFNHERMHFHLNFPHNSADRSSLLNYPMPRNQKFKTCNLWFFPFLAMFLVTNRYRISTELYCMAEFRLFRSLRMNNEEDL